MDKIGLVCTIGIISLLVLLFSISIPTPNKEKEFEDIKNNLFKFSFEFGYMSGVRAVKENKKMLKWGPEAIQEKAQQKAQQYLIDINMEK